MKILGTGLSGLVGSRITELLSNKYDFENLSRKTGVDISDSNAVFTRIKDSSSPFVLHLAAYTDVEEAEKEKNLKEESKAWKINVQGTRNIIDACQKLNKKIIYFSTDMVFSGEKELPGKYNEGDQAGPVGWYATTKFLAEQEVEKSTTSWTILRIAYPYRANFEKKEYVRIFKLLLEEGKEIKAVADHYFTPTFIDDLAPVVQVIIEKEVVGKIHAGGEEVVSPCIAAKKVAQVFSLNEKLIVQTTREEFFKNRAPRGYNLSLNNGRIEELGVRMRSFTDGLRVIKEQL